MYQLALGESSVGLIPRTAIIAEVTARSLTAPFPLPSPAGGGTVDFTMHVVEMRNGEKVLSEATYRACLLQVRGVLAGPSPVVHGSHSCCCGTSWCKRGLPWSAAAHQAGLAHAALSMGWPRTLFEPYSSETPGVFSSKHLQPHSSKACT
jgi:hypothetical protein